MAAPAPATEATQLFNRLGHVGLEDQEAIGRIAWRLKGLVARRPSDLGAAVALIQAFLHSGDRSGAVALTDRVWPARHHLDGDPAETFVGQLDNIGEHDRCIEAIGELLPDVRLDVLQDRQFHLIRAAWAMGDLDALGMRLRTVPGVTGLLQGGPANYIAQLRTAGLARHFAAHQRIIRRHTRDWQVMWNFVVDAVDDGHVEAATYYYGAGSYQERRALEALIYEDLHAYYISQNLSPAVMVDLAAPVLLHVTAAQIVKTHTVAA